MQRSSCAAVELLISKYVDNEVTDSERKEVELHVGTCEACACRLTSYMEMAVLVSDLPMRAPDSYLRDSLFADINRMKAAVEAQRRVVERSSTTRAPLPWQSPAQLAPTTQPERRGALGLSSLGARIWAIASPVAVMSAALLVFFAYIALGSAPQEAEPLRVADDLVLPPGVPTVPVSSALNADVPEPVVTRMASYRPRQPQGSATVLATSSMVSEARLDLRQPTPVFERGDIRNMTDWHLVRDPMHGYALAYPPNWWTTTAGNVRQFFPWSSGGTRYAPCWLEMEVRPNPRMLTAESANAEVFGGSCTPIEGARPWSLCRHESFVKGDVVHDELYAFDSKHIYVLRVSVPQESARGDFSSRWDEAQGIFSRMSASLALPQQGAYAPQGFGPVLFLNGTDIWMLGEDGETAAAVTRGYGVRSYSLSPDLRHVAFTATNRPGEPLATATYLYVTALDRTSEIPYLLWSGIDLHDVTWYGDKELVVIAGNAAGGPGVYRVAVPGDLTARKGYVEAERNLVVKLDSSKAGARGLAVSPDRQLITFMAPLGERRGTDVYAVRLDGSDLVKLVTYEAARLPDIDRDQPLDPDEQAVKSYVWMQGHLEHDAYRFSMLFTSGSHESPTLLRGGYLYSAPGSSSGPLLDPALLGVDDAGEVQIVHVAYSPLGKVAFTGFYSLRDYRAEVLAGLWTADLRGGVLTNIQSQPVPPGPLGIADLQWAPDGTHLIYRQTVPNDAASLVSRYDGAPQFTLVQLDPRTSNRVVLFQGR